MFWSLPNLKNKADVTARDYAGHVPLLYSLWPFSLPCWRGCRISTEKCIIFTQSLYHPLFGAFEDSRQAPVSFVMSSPPALPFVSVRLSVCITSAVTWLIFMKCDIGGFLQNVSRKCRFGYNRTKISETLHENISTFYCFWLYKIA